jgi:hypothetical protein
MRFKQKYPTANLGVLHESFSREDTTSMGSNRSFGIVMAVFLIALSGLNFWHEGRLWPWLMGAATVFLFVALVYPQILHPLNLLWYKFGLLLHRIINPIIMGVMFYGTIVPTGLIMRAVGKDLLRLQLQPEAKSYWIERKPGPAPETFKDPF